MSVIVSCGDSLRYSNGRRGRGESACRMTLAWLVFAALTTLAAGDSSAQSVEFIESVTLVVGGQAGNHVAAISDFNGDGCLDLAVVNGGSDNLSILLGAPGGTFQSEVRVTLGGGLLCPASPVVGDFNRDGNPDLAIGSCTVGSGDVLVLLGVGDGTFSAARRFAVGSQAFSVAVGDFDRDGMADLAVANAGEGDVSILLGVGNGHFGSQSRFAVGSGPASVAVGDLNRDGIPDLVTANGNSDDVSVLLGVGDGSFLPEIRAPVTESAFSANPVSVAVGDLNHDGIPDLAVANWTRSDVSVLLGFGDGTFFPPNRLYTSDHLPACPLSISIGDLNADGNADLVMVNTCRDEVSVLSGLGDGTFSPPVLFEVGNAPRSAVIGDLNHDGKLDVAAVNEEDNTVSVLHNTTVYTATDGPVIDFKPAFHVASGQGTEAVVVADLNRDGKPDLATANRDDDNVSILLGTGTGAFNPAQTFTVRNEPRALAAGDFDRDGKLDLAVVNFRSKSVLILEGDGVGSFNPGLGFAVADGPRAVAVEDIDGNGTLDMVVADYTDRENSILLGNGSGGFSAPTDPLPTFFSAFPTSVAICDLDHDGIPDLVTALDIIDPALSVQMGDGNGSFGVPLAGDIVGGGTNWPIGDPWRRPESVAIGDLNRDGIPDLVTADGGGIYLTTLLGRGSYPLYDSPNDLVSGNKPFSVVIADFNRDGAADLAGANFADDMVAVFAGDGTGSFASPRTFPVGAGPTTLAVGDFDRDGRPDLAVANQHDGSVSILINRIPDQDNDGIADEVDTQPTTYSNDFSDLDLGGTTTGTITERGDQVLTVVEALNPEGVKITADPSGGPVAATVSPCTGALSLSLDGGDEVVVTCGSVTIRVIEGSVGVQFAAPYAPATLAVNAGSAMTFDPTTGTLEAPASNAQPLVVVVSGGDLVVAPGDSVQLPGSGPPMQNILRRAWSLHAGMAGPLGTLGNSTDPGPTVNLDYVYPITDRLAADLRLGHSRFSGSGGANDVDISNLSANLKFVPQATMPWVFFNGGLGLYYVDSRDLEGGYNLGIGVGWRVTPDLDVELTANYHSTFTASPDLEFGKYQLGLIWAF